MNKVQIYLAPLLLAIGIWYFALRPKDSELMNILNSIPVFKENRDKIIRNAGIEAGKVTLLYLAIHFSGILKRL